MSGIIKSGHARPDGTVCDRRKVYDETTGATHYHYSAHCAKCGAHAVACELEGEVIGWYGGETPCCASESR